MWSRLKKITPYSLGLGLILMIAWYIGFDEIFSAFNLANLWFLPLIFGLELLEYSLQVYRAGFLLNNIKPGLSRGLFKNYSIGHAVAFVTPQRLVGEFVRSFAFKKLFNIPLEDVFAFISVERILDVFTLGLFASLSSFIFSSEIPYAFVVGIVFSLLMLLGLLLIISSRFTNVVNSIFARLGFIGIGKFMTNYLVSARKLVFDLKYIFLNFLITVLLWLVDFFRVWLVFYMFGYTLNPLLVGGIIALSYLLAIIFILPGGLGVFEGGAVAVFVLFGVPSGIAFSAIFIERLFSYWLWVIMGFTFLGEKVAQYTSESKLINTKK